MPGTGYDDAAEKIGRLGPARSWRFKLAMLLLFAAAVAVGAALASLFQ